MQDLIFFLLPNSLCVVRFKFWLTYIYFSKSFWVFLTHLSFLRKQKIKKCIRILERVSKKAWLTKSRKVERQTVSILYDKSLKCFQIVFWFFFLLFFLLLFLLYFSVLNFLKIKRQKFWQKASKIIFLHKAPQWRRHARGFFGHSPAFFGTVENLPRHSTGRQSDPANWKWFTQAKKHPC